MSLQKRRQSSIGVEVFKLLSIIKAENKGR